ncbi:MAG: FhaA domain-containing protein [Gaiellaceae bacterium]
MSVLRSIEHRIESIVEGVFGRAFRTHVQPVELARKLAKEMDETKTISVSRVYVPNEYTVYLSPSDRDQFASYEDSLLTELSDYLSEHARREGYALLSAPRVLMEEDDDLSMGEFGIATRMVQPQRAKEPPPPGLEPQAAPSETRIYKPEPSTEAVSAAEAAELDLAHSSATLLLRGERHELAGGTVVLGRSRDCDITVDDPNVSRRHAELRHENGAYWIVDLGSTNGLSVNGKRVDRAKLEPEDEIVLGTTELRFERGF